LKDPRRSNQRKFFVELGKNYEKRGGGKRWGFGEERRGGGK
jgi:hypothetical protein